MLRWLAGATALFGLSGCAGREAATDATMALAEANYPGQLELFDTQRQKDHYRVILAVKGDAVTRIAFEVDADPGNCTPGSACEARFRRAHDDGILIGAKLKALEAALGRCGVVARGVEGSDVAVNFRTVIELDLPLDDQQRTLDQLTPCIAVFRASLPSGAPPTIRAVEFRIVTPDTPGEQAAMRFEIPAASVPARVPSYLLGLTAEEDTASVAKLRLAPDYFRSSDMGERLADVARKAMAAERIDGVVPPNSAPHGMTLDPKRRDVIRTYILACRQRSSDGRPCRTDIAVAMRYDLSNGTASEVVIHSDIRDARGAVMLPTLPGRQ